MRVEVTEGPVGVFEEQVLVAVLRLSSDAYGMNVRREIERVTGRDLAIGAVYATLDRLEAKGLLASSRRGAPCRSSRRPWRRPRRGRGRGGLHGWPGTRRR